MSGMSGTRPPVNDSGLPNNEVGLPDNDSGSLNNELGEPDPVSPENEPRQLANEVELIENEAGPGNVPDPTENEHSSAEEELEPPENVPGPSDNEPGVPQEQPGPPVNELSPAENEPRPENELGLAEEGHEPPENVSGPPSNEPGPSTNDRDSPENVTAPPVRPEFVTPSSRLDTFWAWPVSLATRPNVLYKAGFLYTGNGDRTVCFQCGVEKYNWMDSDNPWFVHAKLSPECPHVLQCKGRDFVERVLRKEGLTASRDLKNVKAPAELKGLPKIDRAIPSTSRSATGSTANSWAGASKGAIKKADCVGGCKGDGGKGGKGKTLKGSLAESKSSDKDRGTETPMNSDSKVKNEMTSKVDDVCISDNILCKICWQEKLGVAFLPCGHLIACAKCATSLDKCPVCCQHFMAAVRIFLP